MYIYILLPIQRFESPWKTYIFFFEVNIGSLTLGLYHSSLFFSLLFKFVVFRSYLILMRSTDPITLQALLEDFRNNFKNLNIFKTSLYIIKTVKLSEMKVYIIYEITRHFIKYKIYLYYITSKFLLFVKFQDRVELERIHHEDQESPSSV